MASAYSADRMSGSNGLLPIAMPISKGLYTMLVKHYSKELPLLNLLLVV
jgi:hypothetical protein